MTTCPRCDNPFTGWKCTCGYIHRKEQKGNAKTCDFITSDKNCPVLWAWSPSLSGNPKYCAYHANRLNQHFKTEQEEYAYFLEWCAYWKRYWIAVEAPETLWRILCGLQPMNSVPARAFRCPLNDQPDNPKWHVQGGSLVKQEDANAMRYRCSSERCEGGTDGCKRAPNCGADARWQKPGIITPLRSNFIVPGSRKLPKAS